MKLLDTTYHSMLQHSSYKVNQGHNPRLHGMELKWCNNVSNMINWAASRMHNFTFELKQLKSCHVIVACVSERYNWWLMLPESHSTTWFFSCEEVLLYKFLKAHGQANLTCKSLQHLKGVSLFHRVLVGSIHLNYPHGDKIDKLEGHLLAEP